MNEEDDNYNDDHDYDDSQNNFESQYKKYFKFDPDAWDAWGKVLYDALNEIVEPSQNVWYIGLTNIQGFPSKSFPVNSYFSNTGKDKTFQYLGNNYDGKAIWKKKYFIYDPLHQKYIDHLKSHAEYFLKQPHYYRSLFEVLN